MQILLVISPSKIEIIKNEKQKIYLSLHLHIFHLHHSAERSFAKCCHNFIWNKEKERNEMELKSLRYESQFLFFVIFIFTSVFLSLLVSIINGFFL